MNAKRTTRLSLAAGALMAAFSLPAAALDFLAPFADPLDVAPSSLSARSGVFGNEKATPCIASRDATAPMHLSEAIDLALCNNSQVRSAWASIKIQAAALGEATSAYLPTISGSVSGMRTETSYPGSRVATSAHNGKMMNSSLAWRLLDFGGREANKDAAKNLLQAALASHDAMIKKTLQDIIQAYFDAQMTKAVLAAREENETIAASILDSAKRRESLGFSARSDTLQATTALAKASLDKSRAIGEYRKALSVLSYTIGLPQQQAIVLADDLSNKTGEDIKTLDVWLEEAQKSHPAIMAARVQFEAAKNKVEATRSEGAPSIDLTASINQNGYPNQGLATTETRNASYGVVLNIPLFDGFSRTYKIRSSQATVEQKEAELHEAERSTLAEIVKTYADASSALRNLKFSEGLLAAARESLSVSKRKYDKGAAEIVEVLSAKAALADAQQEEIRGRTDWSSARLRLATLANKP